MPATREACDACRDDAHPSDVDPSIPWRDLAETLGGARDDVVEIVRLELALAGLRARRALLRLVAVALASVALLTILVGASLHLVRGLAGAFAQLFSGREWAGQLAAGFLVLTAAACGWWLLGLRQDRDALRRARAREGDLVGERS